MPTLAPSCAWYDARACARARERDDVVTYVSDTSLVSVCVDDPENVCVIARCRRKTRGREPRSKVSSDDADARALARGRRATCGADGVIRERITTNEREFDDVDGVIGEDDEETTSEVAIMKAFECACTATAEASGDRALVAFGGANGAVCVYDVDGRRGRRRASTGYGEVVSMAWCAVEGGANGNASAKSERGRAGKTRDVLAVGSRERKVMIYALESDLSLTATHALHLPKPQATLSEAQRGRVWCAVAWAPEEAGETPDERGSLVAVRERRLITSGQGGDLLMWRVPMNVDGSDVVDVKDARTFGPRDVAHTRTVFTITVAKSALTGQAVCVSTSLDRKVACWDIDSLEQLWSFNALGGFVYDISVDALDPFTVILSCGDGTLHAWDLSPTLVRGVRESLVWKGLPDTKATAVAKHPGGDVVAFGLEDGRVGCVDIATGKFAIYPECHGGAVTSLAWFEMRVGDQESVMTLTSASADGGVWRWLDTFNPATTADLKKSGILDSRKYGKVLDLGKLYRGAADDASDRRKIVAFAYSPARGRLALGWSNGALSAHDFDEEVWCRREHIKEVSCVRWHPECDDDASAHASWLASASTSGHVYVHGVGGATVCALPKHAVLDLAWSHRKRSAILACAQHGCVRVWSFDGAPGSSRPTPVADLRGHGGRVLCVAFAAHDDETIVSGGDDKTFRVWKYTDPEHAIDESAVIPAEASAGAREVSDDSASGAKTSASKPKKSSAAKSKKSKSSSTFVGAFFKPCASESTPEGIAAGQRAAITLANRTHRAEFDEPDALERDAETYGPSSVALFTDADSAMRVLSTEAKRAAAVIDEDDGAARERGLEKAAALDLYRGDYASAAATVLAASEAPISSELMSLFIGGGHDVWCTVANAQCERLVVAGEHQRAALLRLSMHDVRGAIQALRLGGLVRDAAALAAARLLPNDNLLVKTRRELAAAEEARGGMEAAAKAYLSIGANAAAVRALTRFERGGAAAAAAVVTACGLNGVDERRVVLRAVIEFAEVDDFDAALATFASADEALDVADGYIRDIVRLERAFTSENVDGFHEIISKLPSEAVEALTKPEPWLEYSLSRRRRRNLRLALARAIFRDVARAYDFTVAKDDQSQSDDFERAFVDATDAADVEAASRLSASLADAGDAAAVLSRLHHSRSLLSTSISPA